MLKQRDLNESTDLSVRHSFYNSKENDSDLTRKMLSVYYAHPLKAVPKFWVRKAFIFGGNKSILHLHSSFAAPQIGITLQLHRAGFTERFKERHSHFLVTSVITILILSRPKEAK